MKRVLIFFLSVLMLLPSITFASNLRVELSGKILLQVEEHGEAWYVNPDDAMRYYLGRPADAFNVMRSLGLGISEETYEVLAFTVPKQLAGKILLRVEAHGEAYYVNPDDLTLHYLGRPEDAFNVMRSLGLGISTSNLEMIPAQTQPAIEESMIAPGYVLFSPMGDTKTYLIDQAGETVHEWKSQYGSAHATYLLDNKHLLRGGKLTDQESLSNIAGGIIEEFSFEGERVWYFEYLSSEYGLHHDFVELENGNILALSWKKLEANGREYLNEEIIEIDKQSKDIVWRWNAYEDGGFEPSGVQPSYIHFNSIDYRNGAIIVSARAMNTVFVIDKDSKKITYSYTGDLQGQHDATFLTDQTALIFNNAKEQSIVEEVNFVTNEVLWSHKDTFFSDRISGAQRLANGNTLICSGQEGHFFEVTPSGEVVWEYVNKVENVSVNPVKNAVFKVRKYDITL